MTKKNNFVPIGKIGSTFGVRGWLKVYAYTEWRNDILQYQPWYLSSDQHNWDPIEITASQEHGRSIIVKFPSIHTPEQAKLLTNKLIAIPRETLPELKANEYYWTDLEGLTVINQHGENLGKVHYLLETGAHDVLVIKRGQEKEWAVPYLPGKVITRVDLAAQKIYIHWEG